MKTIVGLYSVPEEAMKATTALESAGFPPSSIQVLRTVDAIWHYLGCTPRKILVTDFALGALLGIVLYALFGLLVVLGELLIGSSGTTAAGAWSIFMLAGALVGGVLGLVFGAGSLEQESRIYAVGIRRGGAVLVVQARDEKVTDALNLLRQTGAEGAKVCRRAVVQQVDRPAVLPS